MLRYFDDKWCSSYRFVYTSFSNKMVNVTGNRTLSIIFLSILINRDTGLVLINMMVIQDGGYSKYRRNFCVI